jgi:protein SCO1
VKRGRRPENCALSYRGAGLLLCTAFVVSCAFAAGDPPKPAAPRFEFTPPEPGSYVLHRIQSAPDAALLDSDAKPRSLATLVSGKITLLSFFYTYCSDAWGCPFATTTLTGLRETLLREPTLAQRVRFVNISFDPTNDTPAQLRAYAGALAHDPQFEWRFLTAPSLRSLLPLLDGFGQDVSIASDAAGRPTRTRHHMLKMFLIDAQGGVREIYALDYLHPQVMLNDIRTLAMEAARPFSR